MRLKAIDVDVPIDLFVNSFGIDAFKWFGIQTQMNCNWSVFVVQSRFFALMMAVAGLRRIAIFDLLLIAIFDLLFLVFRCGAITARSVGAAALVVAVHRSIFIAVDFVVVAVFVTTRIDIATLIVIAARIVVADFRRIICCINVNHKTRPKAQNRFWILIITKSSKKTQN